LGRAAASESLYVSREQRPSRRNPDYGDGAIMKDKTKKTGAAIGSAAIAAAMLYAGGRAVKRRIDAKSEEPAAPPAKKPPEAS
jgi:hypothetical protein